MTTTTRKPKKDVAATLATDPNAPLQGATLGQRIMQARLRAGLNKSQFGKLVDVSHPTVDAWEADRKEIRTHNLERVAEVVGFSVEALLGRESRVVRDAAVTYPALDPNAPLQGATLGQRIRAAYLRAGMNRSTFARALDAHYTSVIGWEKDEHAPNTVNLERIAEVTGRALEELLDRESRVVREQAQARTIRYWQVRAAEIAESKGWGEPLCVAKASEGKQPDAADTNRVLAAIALIHSEASEATEAARVGDYIARYAADGSGKPEGVAVELADVVIRCMHLCELLGLDLERAVAMKMDYNATRTFRHGGKLA